jgi:DNA-binding transcriptional ArsR family regulator
MDIDFNESRVDDPDTSHEAARSFNPTRLDKIILENIDPEHGATTHELADITGLQIITVSPRMRPLTRAGILCDSGERRRWPQSGRRSIVWKLVK